MDANNINVWLVIIENMHQMYKKMIKRRRQRRKKIKILISSTRQRLNFLKEKQAKAALLLSMIQKKQREYTARSCWIRQERIMMQNRSFWEEIVPLYDDVRFQKKFRVSRKTFGFLCDELRPYIERVDTNFRNAIPLDKRIAVAITVLKENLDLGTVADLFNIGTSTVSLCLYDFCEFLNEHFSNERSLIQFPNSEQEKEIIADGFLKKWQFPCTIGALDSCHIPILAPSNHPEDYYNYKSFHSIILLGVVDYNYKFTYVNIGRPGRCNDDTVLRSSNFFKTLSNNPPPLKYHIIGDAAFPLFPWLLKPYPICYNMDIKHKNFNDRHSSARMVIKNAFGRLKARWRILLKRSDMQLSNMRIIVKACVNLHNLCETNSDPVWPEWLEEVNNLEQSYERIAKVPFADLSAPTYAKVKRDLVALQVMKDGISIN